MEIEGKAVGEIQATPKVKIYYDGMCNLCSGLADTIGTSNQGTSIALTDISKGELPTGVSKKEAMKDVHVIDENGTMYRGADAVLRILREYPHLRWLAFLGSLPVFKQLLAVMYRVIEKTRYTFFGRKAV